MGFGGFFLRECLPICSGAKSPEEEKPQQQTEG